MAPKTLTTQEFIQKAILKHGNFYDYSKSTYIKSSEKLDIICPIHGIFSQRASNHLKGHDCFECSRLNTKTFIYKARQKYGNLYSYDKTFCESGKSDVLINCNIHCYFSIRAIDFLSSKGENCPECRKGKRTREKIHPLTKAFIYYVFQESTNKGYVGVTTQTLEKRFQYHIKDAVKGRKSLFATALRESNGEGFSYVLLDETIAAFLRDREEFWIYKLKTFYPYGFNEKKTGGTGIVLRDISLKNPSDKGLKELLELNQYYRDLTAELKSNYV